MFTEEILEFLGIKEWYRKDITNKGGRFNAIKRYHIETNGLLDIGYHYVIESVEGMATAEIKSE